MRSGLLFGAGAYGMWGLFPAFFPLLKPAGAVEVLAHRAPRRFRRYQRLRGDAGRDLGETRTTTRRAVSVAGHTLATL